MDEKSLSKASRVNHFVFQYLLVWQDRGPPLSTVSIYSLVQQPLMVAQMNKTPQSSWKNKQEDTLIKQLFTITIQQVLC